MEGKRVIVTGASRGIGVYIARGLVEAMGGTIDVVSKSGEGACFGVKLRVAP